MTTYVLCETDSSAVFKVSARDQVHYKGLRRHLLHTVTFLVLHIYIYIYIYTHIQYSHREIPISPARLGDTFCCLGDFLSFHRDNRYSQRDAQVTQRDVVTVHRA